MTAKTVDKRMEKGEQTRTRILHAAITIIAESGIKEVSAAKLATATGVSKSNIFHHFKSIDEILMSVLHIIFDDLLAPMSAEYLDLDRFLDTLGQSAAHVPEQYRNIFKAFFSFYHEGMFHPEYQKALASCTDQITDLICKQLVRLSPKPFTEEALKPVATLLLTLTDGMGLHCLLNGNDARYEEAWRIQVQLIGKFLSEP